MAQRKETCGNCRHYDLDSTFCRRDPPVVVDNRKAYWPRTVFSDWCGRHKRRESK